MGTLKARRCNECRSSRFYEERTCARESTKVGKREREKRKRVFERVAGTSDVCKMEREVQSELEWFTKGGSRRVCVCVCVERTFFGSYQEKKKEDQTPSVCTAPHPFLLGTFLSSAKRDEEGRGGEERRVGHLAPRKINSSLKEASQTERYAGRLASRH